MRFIDWRPDLEDIGNPGLSLATNVLHTPKGYTPVRRMNTGSPLDTSAVNVLAIEVVPYVGGNSTLLSSASGNIGYFSGIIEDTGATATVLRAGLFDGWTGGTAATAVGAYYSATSLQSFEIAELNNDAVMCTRYHNYAGTGLSQNTTTAVGYFVRTSGLYGKTITSVSGSWIDGIASGFAVCGRVGQFVMGGNLTGGSNGLPYSAGVQWSAIGDATDWPTPETDDARAKQSGYEQLPTELGEVTHIGGDDFFAYAFQQQGITKFTYVGGDVVFQVDTFEEARGAWSFNHVTRVDDMYFFESEFSRHMLQGGQIVDIGFGKVDETYPPDHSVGSRIRANASIFTIFFSNNVAYNYKTDQWTYLPQIAPLFDLKDDSGIIGQYATGSGTTSLTTSAGGAAEAAVMATGESELNPGGRAIVDGVRPIINGGTATSVRVGYRDDQNAAVSYTSAKSVNSRTQMANFRDDAPEGRYHRIEVTVSAFDTQLGADIDAKPTGKV